MKNLENCSLKEAHYIKIKDKIFGFDCFNKYDDGVDVRIEFDSWMFIAEKDFDLFGVDCVREKPKPVHTFFTKVTEHSHKQVENHGMIYDIVDCVCVVLPFDKFINYLGKDAEVTVKVL